MVGGNGGRREERSSAALAGTPPLEALDRVTDGFVALDRDWRVTYVNRPAGQMLDQEPEALVGECLWDAYPGLVGTTFETRFREAIATQKPVTFEEEFSSGDLWVAVRAYPSETGLSVYARDVTERHDRERAIREHETRLLTIIESSTDAIMLKDREGRYLLVNRTVAEVLGRSKGEILGRTDEELFGQEVGQAIRARERRALETEETITYEEEVETPDGARVYETTRAPYYGPRGDLQGTVGVCRDVTARKERERDLRRYETLVETSPDPAFALDEEFHITLVNPATEQLTGLDRDELVGEPASVVLDAGVISDEEYADGIETLRELLADDTPDYQKHVVVMHTADGERVEAEYHLGSVVGDDGPAGVVGTVRDITEHREQQRQIRRQRDQLETLDRINALVQETIRGVVEAPTREEIEEMVCEHLADSEFYSFAWIGERTLGGDGVTFRTGVGVDEEWFRNSEVVYDRLDQPDPSRRAIETGEPQVSQDIFDDPDIPSPITDQIDSARFRSGIVVPLRYGDAIYGVLAVAAPRPDAFSERELAAFEALGEAVGFAIDATGNRRLLLGDAAAELQLRVADTAAPLVALSAAIGGRCELERAVPTGGDRLVHYVTVEGADGSMAADNLSDFDGVTDVQVIREDETRALLAVTAGGTVPARLVAAGATPRRFVVDDGMARVAVDVPPGVEVHAVVESLRAAFSDSAVVAKRYVERPHRTALESDGTVARRLTDRQWDALTAALAAGYYEWPRESTAEEIADSMGITSATLHYHLRRAEQTLVQAFLDDSE